MWCGHATAQSDCHWDVHIGIWVNQNHRDTCPSIWLDMKSERRPVVEKTLGHTSMLVVFGSTLGTYWSNHPSTTAAQNTPCTFMVSPFWRSVKHTVPGALAAVCVCVWECVGGCGVSFSTFHIRDSWDGVREWSTRPGRGQLVISRCMLLREQNTHR